MLAVSPNGAPRVAYLRGSTLEIAMRRRTGAWQQERAARVAPGSSLVAFANGVEGPVALVRGPGARTLDVVLREGTGWRMISLARVPARERIGWPGLALQRGLPTVAYSRWRQSTRQSLLVLTRIDARGRLHSVRITQSGFPKSFVAPPAVPVVIRGRTHVIESYGIDGAVGTIEWYPHKQSWTGQFIDGGIGDFPVGRLLGAAGGTGTLYAAWSQVLLSTGEMPVALAVHGRSIESDVVLDRAVTTGLDVTSSGPEVAANEWVSADELGVPGDNVVWAGMVVAHRESVELDGWIGGLSSAPHGARDVLLARPGGLFWYRLRRSPSVRMSIDATEEADGNVVVTGQVSGASRRRVTLYRERPGMPRESVGSVPLAQDGSFRFVDDPPTSPFLYRAVYADASTGLPYSALLRGVLGSSPELSTEPLSSLWKMLKTENFANCEIGVRTGLEGTP
jgi:hypothetical protein